MNTKLNVKQWALATLAVFIIMTIVVFVFQKLGVEPWYWSVPEGQAPTGPDAMTGRISIYLSRLIAAGLFTFIFTKAITDKPGMGHGLRYGFGLGLLMFVPNFVSGLVYSNFSTATQLTFMVVSVIQSVICGAAMAQLYKTGKPTAA